MKTLSIILILITCLSLNSCAFFLGRYGVIGWGKKHVSYYEDGKVKKIELEGKSLIADIFNLSFFKKGD